jgi:hypothetical protein
VGLCLLLAGSTVRGDEKKVALSELPKAVLDAVKRKFPHAELKEATKEVEKNQTTYEVSLVDEGKHIDASLNEKGKIEEIETEIEVSKLPSAVADAVAAKYPKSTIKKAEEIVEFEDGKEEKSYEVVVATTEGKSVEIKLDAKGKIEDDENDKDDENGK